MIKRQLVWFVIAGGIGFSIDTIITLSLIEFDLNPFLSRAIAIPIAMMATFYINKNYTFKRSAKKLKRLRQEAFEYVVANLISQATNWIVYSLLIINSAFFLSWPVLAVAIGSLCAMFLTFTLSKFWVFKR